MRTAPGSFRHARKLVTPRGRSPQPDACVHAFIVVYGQPGSAMLLVRSTREVLTDGLGDH